MSWHSLFHRSKHFHFLGASPIIISATGFSFQEYLTRSPTHKHTPETCVYALLVIPTRCRSPTRSRYSILLFFKWLQMLAHLVAVIAVSTVCCSMRSLPHWDCRYALVSTRSDVQQDINCRHIRCCNFCTISIISLYF